MHRTLPWDPWGMGRPRRGGSDSGRGGPAAVTRPDDIIAARAGIVAGLPSAIAKHALERGEAGADLLRAEVAVADAGPLGDRHQAAVAGGAREVEVAARLLPGDDFVDDVDQQHHRVLEVAIQRVVWVRRALPPKERHRSA